jgi:hypothetical protein
MTVQMVLSTVCKFHSSRLILMENRAEGPNTVMLIMLIIIIMYTSQLIYPFDTKFNFRPTPTKWIFICHIISQYQKLLSWAYYALIYQCLLIFRFCEAMNDWFMTIYEWDRPERGRNPSLHICNVFKDQRKAMKRLS